MNDRRSLSDAETRTALAHALGHEVHFPGDAAYLRATEIWNGAVEAQPVAVVVCGDQRDVSRAVRAARELGLPLSVRGGGHDWAGRSLRHGGLVIDLSAMRQVVIYPDALEAVVGGGATAGDLIAAARPHGLVAATGNVGAVGVAGLTLGGGYGPLMGRFGLAADNLISAEIVGQDGRIEVADSVRNPDLLWALRGGGGNFGVVASMRIRLHPLEPLFAGIVLFSWDQAHAVLSQYASWVTQAPDELSLLAGIFPSPSGEPLVIIAPAWSGDVAAGEEALAMIRTWGTPILWQVAPLPYAGLLSMYDAHIVNGRHYAMETRWMAGLDTQALASMVNAGAARTSPTSLIAIHHFHGAAARVAPDATAFGMRSPHFLVEILASWDSSTPSEARRHRGWAHELSNALASTALPGGYANLLAPDAVEQTAHAYGSNAGRLRELKNRFDPLNVFSSAIALPGAR
ncbi:MAG: FAD-binding oxidoreductase [Gammaproteobacteria bacterium]